MGKRWGRTALVVALAWLAACGSSEREGYLVGEERRIAVSLGGCLSCEPAGVLVGADRELNVYWMDAWERVAAGDDITFESLDPAVLTTELDEESTGRPEFLVQAVAPGDARLRFATRSGDTLDVVTVHVAEPTELRPFEDTVTRAPITSALLRVGEEKVVHVEAWGERGLLLDVNHWTWSVDDAEVATLWSAGGALVGAPDVARLENVPTFVYVRGAAEGTTTLRVQRGGVEARVEIVVTP